MTSRRRDIDQEMADAPYPGVTMDRGRPIQPTDHLPDQPATPPTRPTRPPCD